MQSLLHSTDNFGFTMLHFAAQNGHAEVVQLLIKDYNLDPTARTKVCGQTCRYLANSSRAGGRCVCDRCKRTRAESIVDNICSHGVHPHAVCHEWAHTHTLYCSVHGLHKYVHVFVFDVSLKLHMPPVVYLVGSTAHVAKF